MAPWKIFCFKWCNVVYSDHDFYSWQRHQFIHEKYKIKYLTFIKYAISLLTDKTLVGLLILTIQLYFRIKITQISVLIIFINFKLFMLTYVTEH